MVRMDSRPCLVTLFDVYFSSILGGRNAGCTPECPEKRHARAEASGVCDFVHGMGRRVEEMFRLRDLGVLQIKGKRRTNDRVEGSG